MFMSKRVSLAAAATTLLLLAGIAQSQESRSQVSIGVTGDFSKQSEGNEVVQAPTQSAGFLASYLFTFRPGMAVEINYGYTRNTQNYTLTGPVFAPIQTDIHEVTAAYVYTFHPSARLRPFVQGGGGALLFSPTNTFNNTAFGVSLQTKPAIVYGAGADYKLFGGVALRLQYRGLLYKAPDFGLSNFNTGSIGHIAEPVAGLVFNF